MHLSPPCGQFHFQRFGFSTERVRNLPSRSCHQPLHSLCLCVVLVHLHKQLLHGLLRHSKLAGDLIPSRARRPCFPASDTPTHPSLVQEPPPGIDNESTVRQKPQVRSSRSIIMTLVWSTNDARMVLYMSVPIGTAPDGSPLVCAEQRFLSKNMSVSL